MTILILFMAAVLSLALTVSLLGKEDQHLSDDNEDEAIEISDLVMYSHRKVEN